MVSFFDQPTEQIPNSILEEIRANSDAQNWYHLSRKYILTENLIEEFANNLIWHEITYYQILSEKIIRKHIDKLNRPVCWINIAYRQKLSEEFIYNFSNKISWAYVSRYQNLSQNFIANNFHKLHMSWLVLNDFLSQETKNYIRMFI